MKKNTAYNSGLAKKRVSCFYDTFVVKQTFVLLMNFSAKKSASSPSRKTLILQPCHWSFTVEQRVNGEAILISTAKLDSGWHLYSQHISNKGPRTEFACDSLDTYTLLGDTQEGKPNKEYNPYLEMEVLYFEKVAVFKQKIEVQSKMDFTIAGTVDYMVCRDEYQCVHSDEDFSFKVKGNP